MLKIDSACHVAFYSPMLGGGVIVTPSAHDDVTLSALEASVHAADELALLRRLEGHGVELALDEHGDPWVHAGTLDDGREAFYLVGDPVAFLDDEAQEEAHAELRRVAGLIPEQRRGEDDRTA